MNELALAGSKTSLNLAAAFAAESEARNRYLFFAESAKKEGYPAIEQIFKMTADDERGHAEVLLNYLSKGGLNGAILHPKVIVMTVKGTMSENLFSAAQAEYMEWEDIYPTLGKTAEEEGFLEIAETFYAIATVEKRHDLRFRSFIERYEKDMLFRSDTDATWQCINCGYRHVGKTAPHICPACRHPMKYFKIIKCN